MLATMFCCFWINLKLVLLKKLHVLYSELGCKHCFYTANTHSKHTLKVRLTRGMVDSFITSHSSYLMCAMLHLFCIPWSGRQMAGPLSHIPTIAETACVRTDGIWSSLHTLKLDTLCIWPTQLARTQIHLCRRNSHALAKLRPEGGHTSYWQHVLARARL